MSIEENNVEELRQRKIEELRKKQAEEQAEDEYEMQINAMLSRLLSEKARERLANVKLVNKGLYFKVVQAIVYLAKAGHVNGTIEDHQLKSLLIKLNEKKEITIKRK